MENLEKKGVARRALIAGRLAFFWAAILCARLIYLQVIKHDELAQKAANQHHHTYDVPPDRGEIRDRTGAPLAISVRTRSLVVNPLRVANPGFLAGLVGPVVGQEPAALAAKITELKSRAEEKQKGRGFLMVQRHLSDEQLDRLKLIRQKMAPVLEFRRDARRIYANGMTAAHVVGSLDAEGNGNAGVEQKLNAELKGKHGSVRALTDSVLDRYITWTMRQSEPGVNVTLTLNRMIQYEAEAVLADAVTKSGAGNGSVVVMDPHSGELLALANYPSFDPRRETPTPEEAANRLNAAVQAPCEPGSVLKMITASMGLDTGKFTPDTPIYCENGVFPRPGRKPIHDLHRYGGLTLAGVVIKSSNIGVAKIALASGQATMYDYLKRFGMGDKTNLPLPGESGGMLRPLAKWDPASHEYMAFGHEIGATGVQMARAVSVIANGGVLVQPRLILALERPNADGGATPLPVPGAAPRRVIKPETAHQMRLIMRQVVEAGTGRQAHLAGYSAGGKTGSAELFDFKARKWINRHNASFIGFAPVTNPRVVVVVTLNGSRQLGGVAAAPVFREVTQTALRILHAPKDVPEQLAKARPEAEPRPASVLQGRPQPGANERYLSGPQAPDFTGKPVAAVLRESAARNIEVETIGQGVARAQWPAPGTVLAPGGRVIVEFSR